MPRHRGSLRQAGVGDGPPDQGFLTLRLRRSAENSRKLQTQTFAPLNFDTEVAAVELPGEQRDTDPENAANLGSKPEGLKPVKQSVRFRTYLNQASDESYSEIVVTVCNTQQQIVTYDNYLFHHRKWLIHVSIAVSGMTV
jgi:hypothetical protein